MPQLPYHSVQFWVFIATFALVAVLGFKAARWRRPTSIHSLDEWGLGGRAFGGWVTFFLLSGDIYTAYTFVAVPTLMYGVGAAGFFPVPFLVIMYPMLFVVLVRFWSVSHAHGFVTPAEFVRARFGSRTLALMVALTGIVATMPYIALQMIGVEAVFKTMGLTGRWPLTLAFAVLALYTFNSGLRAPALISIVKDVLILWTVLAAVLIVGTLSKGWSGVFSAAAAKFAESPSHSDGLLLNSGNQVNYITLALGSAAALFLYPHTLTGVLAARSRATVRRNLAALPLYTMLLGVLALLGYVAIAGGVLPIGGDRNTVVPLLFASVFPSWCAGLAYAAIGVGAMVPAAIMSIAAANLFTRNIYREYFRKDASPAEETWVSKIASLSVKAGAVLVIVVMNTQFAIDLQLIGGVIILQTLPAVAIGLYSAWLHRGAVIAGLVAGLTAGLVMLYQVPQRGGRDGTTILRPHFGGSAWPLSHLGLGTNITVYVGVLALAVNLLVAVALTPVLRALRVPHGDDVTRPADYVADQGQAKVRPMTEMIDGSAIPATAYVSPAKHHHTTHAVQDVQQRHRASQNERDRERSRV